MRSIRDVRFTPGSGHSSARFAGPLSARSGHLAKLARKGRASSTEVQKEPAKGAGSSRVTEFVGLGLVPELVLVPELGLGLVTELVLVPE